MKGCKAWQTIFGIICLFMTIALGTVTVVLFLPYLGGELSAGVFASMHDSLAEIAKTVGIDGSIAVWGVVFALPTILLLLATNLLIYGRHSKNIVTGCILALLSVAISGGITALFRKSMFDTYQRLYILVLGGIAVVLLFMFIATLCAVGNAKRKSKIQTADVDEIAVTVGEHCDQAANQSTDDVLFMAQDYSSVSDVSDTTYEHTDVLPQKVLDKLKIARELYEKGAITKEEYLDIVNKYITQQ